MNYIVLDLEWNLPLSKANMIKKPVKLGGEIIQIGAVKMDEALNRIIDEFDVMVQPRFYKKMHKKAQDITLITNEVLRFGIPFEEAINQFREWCGKDHILLTWGDADVPMLENNLNIHGMDYRWIPESFDVQLMFDDEVTMENRNFSLSYAIWKLGIKPFPAHNALNDAKNTGEIIKRLDAPNWIEEERRYMSENMNCVMA
ncbi:MAG: 3'-5' exonuclease [Lachnospiraceae bacterium]|nr:3'-5' exonuclease [Lachnospiraceae bacterium]